MAVAMLAGSKVLEHFDENGQPAAARGNLIEPGHLYEWYWLVNEYRHPGPACIPRGLHPDHRVG